MHLIQPIFLEKARQRIAKHEAERPKREPQDVARPHRVDNYQMRHPSPRAQSSNIYKEGMEPWV